MLIILKYIVIFLVHTFSIFKNVPYYDIIFFRFPVPDFRPVHDMQRIPWWKRNVRPDFLTLTFTDATLQSSINSKQPCFRYELQCRTLDLHYTVSYFSCNSLQIYKLQSCKKSVVGKLFLIVLLNHFMPPKIYNIYVWCINILSL